MFVPRGAGPRWEFLQTAMAVMLICPRCQGDTELRGTMDAWYLTWCPACERLWRLEFWSLVNTTEPPELKLPSIAREKRGR